MNNTLFKVQFHYNVFVSRAKLKPQSGVFFQGKYHLVDNVICNVPTKGVFRKGMQPNWLMECEITQDKFKIINNICYIG
jgi:hypothetical protein